MKAKDSKTTTIRDIPRDVYNEIHEIAMNARRSINSQIIIQLEKSLKKQP